MLSERRSAFEELITGLRVGRLSRRRFLERALALGLSCASALSLLEGCGDETLYLIWQDIFDPSNTSQQLVDDFNRRNQGRIHVTLQMGPNGTDDLATIEREILKAQSTAVDIFSVDIIYIAEFARQRWLLPISESRWPPQERAKYLRIPIEACTFNGQLWAVPYRSDIGLLYYRTDRLPRAPGSWEELTSMAEAERAKQGSPAYGYVWQAAQYEGLVCNFEEVLYGYGGSLFSDPFHPTVVTVDSSQARQALTTMVNWKTRNISPENIGTYTEEVTRNAWERGEALFMRNWPYAYSYPPQKSRGYTFGVHPMLPGGSNSTGHASLGGWQLGINAFADSARQEAAWEFIKYMLQPEAQRIGAMTESWTTTLTSMYEDPAILRKCPIYNQLQPMFQTAVLRPIAPNYADISTAIRFHVRQALSGQVSVADTLKALAARLKQLVNQPE